MLERLPYKLRTVTMFTLCMIYTAFVRRLYDECGTWRRKMRVKLSGSPQVCVLKKVIYDELGISIEIEEGDGKPYDFVVKSSIVDTDQDRQIFALLERYKMAGKSYNYVNSEIDFECEWMDYVCEQCEYSVEWMDYICERKQKKEYVILVNPKYSANGFLSIHYKALETVPASVYLIATSYEGKVDKIEVSPEVGTNVRVYAYMYEFELRSLELAKTEDYNYKYILKNDTSI